MLTEADQITKSEPWRSLRPDARPIAVRVRPAAEHALRQGHPWVFDHSIEQQSRAGAAGDLAVVFDRKRKHFLAIGLWDPASPIRMRVLQHHTPVPIDGGWWRQRAETAMRLRAQLPASGTTGYRLVHGENDGLPGLVLDRYGSTLVMKLYTAALAPHLTTILDTVVDLAAPWPIERILVRLSRAVQAQAATLAGLANGQVVWGHPLVEEVRFLENGLQFVADPVRGQKTGFFLDQRDNRARVELLADGQDVLNVFAYSGGFSVYAARGGARSVLSLDSSRPALAAAERNFALNQGHPRVAQARHDIVAADAFQALAELRRQRREFGLVIVDPPALAKEQSQVAGALAAYGRLTALALRVLAPGGILVMASCSSRVTAAHFFAAVHQAASEVGRPLRELERTGHPADHPIGFAEGAYLKCLFARAP